MNVLLTLRQGVQFQLLGIFWQNILIIIQIIIDTS
jgi:hypothetical protein